ncbi:hypothetical protein VTO73DRAFT_12035 [Trametes versicolor]
MTPTDSILTPLLSWIRAHAHDSRAFIRTVVFSSSFSAMSCIDCPPSMPERWARKEIGMVRVRRAHLDRCAISDDGLKGRETLRADCLRAGEVTCQRTVRAADVKVMDR